MKAPYNFVPLNKEVFFPDWADKVSQEYPFSDGESGSLDIEIEALSPIFIKHGKEYSQNEVMEFCHFIDENGNKKYYIPGSSLKGMIRSVLEILSFSKLNFFDDKNYAFRDFYNSIYKKELLNNGNNIYIGWLFKKNGRVFIKKVGKAISSRIKYEDLKKFLDEDKVNRIKNAKEAYKKYEIVGNELIETPNGKVVFTGSTGNKTREFLFPLKGDKIYEIDKETFKKFKDAYYIGTNYESEDWKNVWKDRFENGEEIPVFFSVKDDKVIHFGLSMLYKLPYKHSIKDGIYLDHLKDKLDLSQTIFGIEANEKGLKGRVIFSHLEGYECEEDGVKEEILATPRASYYPIYLAQNCNNGSVDNYKTYNDDNFVIAGRKRYPIRNNIFSTNPTPEQSNVTTKFKPLKKGKFKGKMVYHNLKKEELGAILSAITFHLNNECYHNIGMAKPLGYGKIKIKINGIDTKEYIKEFEKVMTKFKHDWIESDELIELFTMAKPHNFNDLYMELKEFMKEKRNKHCLKRFSAIVNDKVYPKSLLSEEEKKNLLIEAEENKKYKAQEAKVLEIVKKSKIVNETKTELKNLITQIEQILKNISFENLKEELLSVKNNLDEKLKNIEIKEEIKKLEKLKKEIEKFIEEKNIKKLEEFLTKELPKDLKDKIELALKELKNKKTDFFEELKRVKNIKKLQSLIGSKNYKLTQKEIEALIEKIKEIYPTLKSKEKKSFFNKVKISKISQELEEKIKNIIKSQFLS